MFSLYHTSGIFIELERSTGKSAGCKVEDLVELNGYDTERLNNTGCSEVKHRMYLMNSQ